MSGADLQNITRYGIKHLTYSSSRRKMKSNNYLLALMLFRKEMLTLIFSLTSPTPFAFIFHMFSFVTFFCVLSKTENHMELERHEGR